MQRPHARSACGRAANSYPAVGLANWDSIPVLSRSPCQISAFRARWRHRQRERRQQQDRCRPTLAKLSDQGNVARMLSCGGVGRVPTRMCRLVTLVLGLWIMVVVRAAAAIRCGDFLRCSTATFRPAAPVRVEARSVECAVTAHSRLFESPPANRVLYPRPHLLFR